MFFDYFFMFIDYALKSKVMASGLDLLQKDVSKSFYANYVLMSEGLVCNHKYTIEEAEQINE